MPPDRATGSEALERPACGHWPGQQEGFFSLGWASQSLIIVVVAVVFVVLF